MVFTVIMKHNRVFFIQNSLSEFCADFSLACMETRCQALITCIRLKYIDFDYLSLCTAR